MENTTVDFLSALAAALALRAQWLQATVIPALNEDLRSVRALVDSIVGALVKKGLLKEEHYSYDERPSALAVPPDTAISDSSESEVAGARLAAWRKLLDLVVDPARLQLDTLDLASLAGLSSVVSYVDWTGFDDGSASAITRTLARLVVRVRLSPDVLSARVLHESQAKLEEIMPRVRAGLSEIERWLRESWKAELRARVLSLVVGKAAARPAGYAEEAIRKAYGQVFPGKPWHPELFQEIVGEDLSEDSAERKRKLLSSLQVPAPGAAPPAQSAERRTVLMSSVRGLCQIAPDITSAESILNDNESALPTRKRSLLQRFLQWLHGRPGAAGTRLYDVSLRESPKAEPRQERIDFARFMAELRELSAVLRKLADESGAEGLRLQAMTDEELCDLLGWQTQQLRSAHRKMEALNELFQVQAASRPRGSVQSIKLELLRIENGLARAEKGCAPEGEPPPA